MADSPGVFRLKQIFIRTLTIDHNQVPSTQSDFPILVRLSHWTLRNEIHGGHVVRSDGFDIGFYSDAGITTKLKWEIERYDAGTGEVVAWVKIASVSSVSDTVFYLSYGDPTITTDQSDAANTFSNSFLSVWHFKNGITLNLNDSLGSFNLTGTNNPSPVGFQIDGGMGLISARTQQAEVAIGPSSAAITLSIWVNGVSFPSDYNTTIVRGESGTDRYGIFVKSNGKLFCTVKASTVRSYDGTGTNTLSAGTSYYLAMAYDSTNGLKGYVNATSDGTVAADGAADTTANKTAIGYQSSTSTRYWNGVIDEARVASVARSADWITCEYNNQKDGSTFLTLGAET